MTEHRQHPSHKANLVALKRIEGQVRGIQKMIAENRYCIDILVQINSVIGAIERVENIVLQLHLEHCVTDALKGKSSLEKQKKIAEVIDLIKRFRKRR